MKHGRDGSARTLGREGLGIPDLQKIIRHRHASLTEMPEKNFEVALKADVV